MRTWAFRLGVPVALLALVLAFTGCSGNSTGSTHKQMTAVLSGTQQVPAVDSTASGFATVTLNTQPTVAGIRGQRTIDVSVNTTGLKATDVMSAHINFGKAGVNGPVIFDLFLPNSGLYFPNPLTVRLSIKDFQVQNTSMSYDQVIDALQSGNTYIDIHTTKHQNGELRGQVGMVQLQSTLNGTSATENGTAQLHFDDQQAAVIVALNTQGLTNNVTAVTVRFGTVGSNGPVLFTMFSNPLGGILSSPFSAILTNANFVVPPPSTGIANFYDAVNAMVSGRTYFTIETKLNPNGEVSGVILPTP